MNQIRHFEIELAELKRSLVSMGNLVEQSVNLGLQAILHPVVEAREQVRSLEHQLDEFETTIEDRCHQIIALQAPMARDLRLIISAMRITSDLEQIGDLAENLTKRARYIAQHNRIENPAPLAPLGHLTLLMTTQTLDSFISGNLELARLVITEEDEADRLTKQCYEAIQEAMALTPTCIREFSHLLRAVSYLEHIADIAVSIAEDTVYLYRGTMIRHQHHDLLPP